MPSGLGDPGRRPVRLLLRGAPSRAPPPPPRSGSPPIRSGRSAVAAGPGHVRRAMPECTHNRGTLHAPRRAGVIAGRGAVGPADKAGEAGGTGAASPRRQAQPLARYAPRPAGIPYQRGEAPRIRVGHGCEAPLGEPAQHRVVLDRHGSLSDPQSGLPGGRRYPVRLAPKAPDVLTQPGGGNSLSVRRSVPDAPKANPGGCCRSSSPLSDLDRTTTKRLRSAQSMVGDPDGDTC